MEYDGQHLQFISKHYFQAKHGYHGIYPNIINLIYTITQFSLLGITFISYLTTKYMHPWISDRIDQYSRYLKCYYSSQCAVTSILFCSLFIINFLFTIFLIILHIGSIIEFINYGNEVLDDNHIDHFLPYVHAAFSSFAIITMFSFAFGFCIYKRSMHYIIIKFTLVNTIYLLSYFGPFMFLALIHVPLIIITLIFTIVAVFVVWCFVIHVLSFFVTKKYEFKFFNYNIVKILLLIIFLYVFALTVVIVIHAFFLGSYNNSQSLQAIVIAFLAGLMSSFLLQSLFKKSEDNRRDGPINANHYESFS